MEGEAWVGGSEGFGYTYRDRGVDSPVTSCPVCFTPSNSPSETFACIQSHEKYLCLFCFRILDEAREIPTHEETKGKCCVDSEKMKCPFSSCAECFFTKNHCEYFEKLNLHVTQNHLPEVYDNRESEDDNEEGLNGECESQLEDDHHKTDFYPSEDIVNKVPEDYLYHQSPDRNSSLKENLGSTKRTNDACYGLCQQKLSCAGVISPDAVISCRQIFNNIEKVVVMDEYIPKKRRKLMETKAKSISEKCLEMRSNKKFSDEDDDDVVVIAMKRNRPELDSPVFDNTQRVFMCLFCEDVFSARTGNKHLNTIMTKTKSKWLVYSSLVILPYNYCSKIVNAECNYFLSAGLTDHQTYQPCVGMNNKTCAYCRRSVNGLSVLELVQHLVDCKNILEIHSSTESSVEIASFGRDM
jgi:hypothetical protein